MTKTIDEVEVTVSISDDGYLFLEFDDNFHIKDRAALYLLINKAVSIYEEYQDE